MNRDVAAIVVVALLAILALSAASATLDSSVEGGTGPSGEVPDTAVHDNATDDGEVPTGKTPEPGTDTGSRPEICFPILNEPPVIGLLVGLWVVLVVGVWRRYYAEFAATVGVFAGIWGALIHNFVADCGPLPSGPPLPPLERKPPDTPTPQVTPTVQPGNGSAGLGATVTEPSVTMGLLVVALLAIGVLVVYRMSGDDEMAVAEVDEGAEEADVAAIGSVAGSAADRIEGESTVENEVYRAWTEMTTYLDVDRPGASTPGEFADAAVTAGMAERDVAELTRLFEEVRYGDRPADADRTGRAVAALRRIEREYADVAPGDDATLDDSADAGSIDPPDATDGASGPGDEDGGENG